jgi:hypothetical protein
MTVIHLLLCLAVGEEIKPHDLRLINFSRNRVLFYDNVENNVEPDRP